MGMRQRNVNTSNRASQVRVINRNQKVGINKKKLIAPCIALGVMIILIIVLIVIKASSPSTSSGIDTVDKSKDNFINQLYGFATSIGSGNMDGTIEGVDMTQYLDSSYSTLASAYTTFYFKSEVTNSSTATEIYGLAEDGTQQYITTVVNTSSGSYAECESFYQLSDLAETMPDIERYYDFLMGDASYIQTAETGLRTGRDQYLLCADILATINDTKAFEIAKTDTAYSLKIPGVKMPQIESDGLLARLFNSNKEDLISTFSIEGERPERVLTIGIQKGSIVIKGTVTESTVPSSYSSIYAIPSDRLLTTLESLQTISSVMEQAEKEEQRKAAEEQAKKELGENESSSDDKDKEDSSSDETTEQETDE